jgi:predicted TPR repeat methyltransferase
MRPVEAYTRLAEVYDEVVVVDPCHAAWAAFLDDLFRADDEDVRDVLDVCCGTGLLAAELVALGYRVTGVDASEAMLERARRLLGPETRLIRAALPDLPVEQTFDAAVCTMDGVNYLAPEELRGTIAAVARRLRPAGWLVFDAHTDAMLAFAESGPVVSGEQNGHRFAISSALDADARACDTRIELAPADGEAPFSEEHRQYVHRESEIRAALADAGFEVTSVRDDYSDRPADDATLSATWISRLQG